MSALGTSCRTAGSDNAYRYCMVIGGGDVQCLLLMTSGAVHPVPTDTGLWLHGNAFSSRYIIGSSLVYRWFIASNKAIVSFSCPAVPSLSI